MIKNLYELTAVEIIQSIKNNTISTVDIVKSFIKRTELMEPIIHAFAAFSPEYVIQQAEKNDQSFKQGLLTGLPIGIKDIFNTEFYPTQKGTPAWEGYKAGNDARCVSYLRQAGGLIFGKTDTAELAVHANGKACNPYHLSHVTGSSSGGSAAAVSAAMVPVALGSQTGGSTIRPASWCGVYAMKPSFGLIPRTGVLKTTDTLDTIGFFGRSVSDLELLFEAMRVHGDNFPIQEKKLKKYRDSINRKWRIAFCQSHLWENTESYVKVALENLKSDFLAVQNVEIVEVKLPKSTLNFRELHRRIYHPCLAYYLKSELRQSQDKISEILLSIFDDAKTIPSNNYADSLKEQSILANEIENFFIENKIDAIIVNSSNGSAPYGGEPSVHLDLNPLWTMTWLPVINVPKFKCHLGLPFGFQIVGPRYSDYKLFALMHYLRKNNLIPNKSEIACMPTKMVVGA